MCTYYLQEEQKFANSLFPMNKTMGGVTGEWVGQCLPNIFSFHNETFLKKAPVRLHAISQLPSMNKTV